MKRKFTIVTVLFLLTALCFAGCGKSEDKENAKENAGIYYLVAVNGLSGELMAEALDYESLDAAREDCKIELKANGMCSMDMMGEAVDGYWSLHGEKITISEKKNPSEDDENRFDGRLANGGLILNIEGSEFAYAVEGKEETALSMSKLEDPLAGLGDLGASSSSVPGETYDTGLFTVLIPEGWLAVPVADMWSDDGAMDPERLDIYKGAADADDTYGKNAIQLRCAEDGEYTLFTSTFDSYEEIEPVTIGNYIYNGVDGYYGYGQYDLSLYTTVGSGYVAADVWYKVEDSEISLEDADVQAILGSIAVKGAGAGTDSAAGGDAQKDQTEFSGEGETYDTGTFSVFVPEGWLACPVEDFITDELDSSRLDIVKGAENTDDTYGHLMVALKCDEEEDYYFNFFVYESYEDIDPVSIGGRTWEGVDAKLEEDHYNYVLHTPLSTGYISADVKYRYNDMEITLDDPDVVAILSSISLESSGMSSAGGSTDREEAKDSSKGTTGGSHEDAGYYEIVSYEEDGEKYHRTVLEEYGITFDLMLYEDGTGYAHFMGDYYDLTWKDGTLYVETDEGTETLTYTTAYLGRNHIYIEDDISSMTFEYAGEAY